MKTKIILLIILIAILFISLITKQEDNVTGFAAKNNLRIDIRDEHRQCKLEASKELNKCFKERTYRSSRENKACQRLYINLINECIRKRENNRKSTFI